jgi:hypothetical protein
MHRLKRIVMTMGIAIPTQKTQVTVIQVTGIPMHLIATLLIHTDQEQ